VSRRGTLSIVPWLRRVRRHDLAVDLGTANTVVYRRGDGVVIFEPSVVAIDEQSGEIQAVGEAASRMIGRTPATIRATRPLRHGVVTDFEATEQMLRHFLQAARVGRFSSPRVVLCVPSGITDVERRAVEEAAVSAGARAAYLIEEPMAGAIGAGLPVAEPSGTMVVDIGGGTSEVAIIALGGMVVSQSLRVGGYDLDEAIIRHIRDEHRLLIGQQRAEEVKIEIGSAWPLGDETTVSVAGRDLASGLLRRVVVGTAEARSALDRPLAQIIESVKSALEQAPPELAADISRTGLVVVGGGGLLRGIDERLRQETDLPVIVAESPLTCVALGAGQSLEEWETLRRTSSSRRTRSGLARGGGFAHSDGSRRRS
jgi:rod shape-determining protein MreB and related proteins